MNVCFFAKPGKIVIIGDFNGRTAQEKDFIDNDEFTHL